MGRYQQWLQHQEIHKRLSSQVEALEAELAKLHDCLDQLGQHQEVASFTDNPVMQALMAQMTFQAVSLNSNARYMLETHNPSEAGSDESGDSISPALRSWGELPNFELYEIREPILVDHQSPAFFKSIEEWLGELLPGRRRAADPAKPEPAGGIDEEVSAGAADGVAGRGGGR